MGLQKKIQFCFIALLMVTVVSAQDKPASPPEVANGTINGATIQIKYSSPSVKGREIWGKLVPFNEVWRAGANEATTFETDKDLTIEGAKLPAGKYSLFIIPSETACIVIFNKDAKQWGAYKYKEKEDQLRVTVKQQTASTSAEILFYGINKDNVVLSWENWNIPFSVQ
jgi:hypothetical protein